MSLLDRLDAAIDGRCPCGADPREGSAYCSDDCVPNYRARDTSSDTDGTAMRWRPDLITATDNSDLALIGTQQRGQRTASLYNRRGGSLVHLRLDDGHRWVGCDIDTSTTGGYDGTPLWEHPRWDDLERELTGNRQATPDPAYDHDGDPWADLASRACNCGCFTGSQELGDAEDPRFPQWLSEAIERAAQSQYATTVAQSGGPDPQLSGTLFAAPLDGSHGWQLLGTVIDDGLNADWQGIALTGARAGETVTVRLGACEPRQEEPSVQLPDGDLESGLTAAQAEAALRDRARRYATAETPAPRSPLPPAWHWMPPVISEQPGWRDLLRITSV